MDTYINMPTFNSVDEYIQLAKKSQFKFNWICTHPPNDDDIICLYASYKDPKYYGKCSAKKSQLLNQIRRPIEKIEKQNRKNSFENAIYFSQNLNMLRIMSGMGRLSYATN